MTQKAQWAEFGQSCHDSHFLSTIALLACWMLACNLVLLPWLYIFTDPLLVVSGTDSRLFWIHMYNWLHCRRSCWPRVAVPHRDLRMVFLHLQECHHDAGQTAGETPGRNNNRIIMWPNSQQQILCSWSLESVSLQQTTADLRTKASSPPVVQWMDHVVNLWADPNIHLLQQDSALPC